MNAYILTKENLSLVIDNVSYSISRSDPLFPSILEALRANQWDVLKNLADKTKAVLSLSRGSITIEGDVVKYKGQVIHNVITQRILDFLVEGLPFEPLARFLENLLENPSKRAVDETYTFLEHKSLPLTEDGHFLAYKAVTNDFKDKHTKKVDNSIGKVVWMNRRDVDDNPNNSCSNGYHAGSIEYVKNFGNDDGDRLLIIKINPKNVVSVPKEDCRKMRVCEYTVVAEYIEDLKAPCYAATKTHQQPTVTDTRLNHLKQKRDSNGRFI